MCAGNCIFLNELVLAMKVSLVDSDGDPPPDGAVVAPINAFPMTMFRQVRMYLNDVEVSSGEHGVYPLRAYTNLALNYNLSQQHGWLEMFGYYPDVAGKFLFFTFDFFPRHLPPPFQVAFKTTTSTAAASSTGPISSATWCTERESTTKGPCPSTPNSSPTL